MARHLQRTLGRKLALIALTLIVCLQPIWAAKTAGDWSVCGRGQKMAACCMGSEPGSCCPKFDSENDGPAMVFVPVCCRLDAPVQNSRETEPNPSFSGPDPTKRALGEFARAFQHVAWFASEYGSDFGKQRNGLGHAPPGSAQGLRSTADHWLTDRETLAALAMLSIARL